MTIKLKRAIVLKDECVACGCCVEKCPKNAIHIDKGMYAVIFPEKCVGCGICKKVCPASVISLEEVQ